MRFKALTGVVKRLVLPLMAMLLTIGIVAQVAKATEYGPIIISGCTGEGWQPPLPALEVICDEKSMEAQADAVCAAQAHGDCNSGFEYGCQSWEHQSTTFPAVGDQPAVTLCVPACYNCGCKRIDPPDAPQDAPIFDNSTGAGS